MSKNRYPIDYLVQRSIMLSQNRNNLPLLGIQQRGQIQRPPCTENKGECRPGNVSARSAAELNGRVFGRSNDKRTAYGQTNFVKHSILASDHIDC